MVKQAQEERQSAHRTQWAAQFAVASELCKRGYEVAVTMGNHPVVDLMVVSPALFFRSPAEVRFTPSASIFPRVSLQSQTEEPPPS